MPFTFRSGGGGGGKYSSSGHDPLEEDEADDHPDEVELLLWLSLLVSLSKDEAPVPARDCNDGPHRFWAEREDTETGRGSPIGRGGASASTTSTAVPPSCVVAEYGAAGGQPPSLASE